MKLHAAAALMVITFAPPIALPVYSQTIASLRDLEWSPSEALVVIAQQDGVVQIVDVVTDQIVLAWQADTQGPTVSVSWSPDGSKIATGGADAFVRVWDATTGQLLSEYEHFEIISAVDWHPDGMRIASFDYGGQISVWDAVTGELLVEAGSAYIVDGGWSPDGAKLANIGSGSVEFWDPMTGDTLGFVNGPNTLSTMSWSPDASQVAASTVDGRILIWDVATGDLEHTLSLGDIAAVHALAWKPDSQLLAAGNDAGVITIWDVATGQMMETLQAAEALDEIAWSPDGTYLAYGDTHDLLRITRVGGPAIAPVASGTATTPNRGG